MVASHPLLVLHRHRSARRPRRGPDRRGRARGAGGGGRSARLAVRGSRAVGGSSAGGTAHGASNTVLLARRSANGAAFAPCNTVLLGRAPMSLARSAGQRHRWARASVEKAGRFRDPRPSDPASRACERPHGRPVPRAAECSRPRPGSAPLAGAFQPPVPACVRRDASPVPRHPPARASGCAAAQHRSNSRGRVPGRRAAGHRVVHDQLRACVRRLANRLSRCAPRGGRERPGPDLRSPGLRAAAVQQFSRRQAAAGAGSVAADPTTPEVER
jgi:hypothetical protein